MLQTSKTAKPHKFSRCLFLACLLRGRLDPEIAHDITLKKRISFKPIGKKIKEYMANLNNYQPLQLKLMKLKAILEAVPLTVLGKSRLEILEIFPENTPIDQIPINIIYIGKQHRFYSLCQYALLCYWDWIKCYHSKLTPVSEYWGWFSLCDYF